MCNAGLDVNMFEVYSTRSACTLAAFTQGVTTENILSVEDWSTEYSFQRFYYKPVCNTMFATSILSATTTPLICETEPSEISMQNAKTAKRLNAIQDYIRMVKSSVSMVPAYPRLTGDMPTSCYVQ